MKSMTGYGRGSAEDEHCRVTVDLATVNRRSLEIALSLPREWQCLEKDLSDAAKASLGRGRLQAQVEVQPLGRDAALSWDETRVAESLQSMRRFAHEQGFAFEPNADTLLRLIVQLDPRASRLPAAESAWPVLIKAFQDALQALCAMRQTEGEQLAVDLASRLGLLIEQITIIREHADGSVARYREQLMQRLQEAGLNLDLNDERLLKEIALFADRCDIQEELTRLDSHFEQFGDCLNSDEMIGRKMDFLCQEIHREINTMGSKSSCIEITRAVIEAKNELERIREQVQNVE